MISSMLQYIQKSPDCFHAVENLRQRLLSEGYTQLTAGEWTLIPGGKYFVTKNGSSLMAFRVPQDRPTGFVLTASHSDSPCFRLRDHAELTGEFVRLSAERYGGMINDCWLDRPLSVAGRVLVRRENGLDMRLVDMKKDIFFNLVKCCRKAGRALWNAAAGTFFRTNRKELSLFEKALAACAALLCDQGQSASADLGTAA